jgi:lambda repressor-like predicted transcriptional regulator
MSQPQTPAIRSSQLRTIRRKHGLSLWGLAVRARTSPGTLSAIERWGYRPGTELQQRIATALGVAVTEIWPGVEAQG